VITTLGWLMKLRQRGTVHSTNRDMRPIIAASDAAVSIAFDGSITELTIVENTAGSIPGVICGMPSKNRYLIEFPRTCAVWLAIFAISN